jgi:hypothetical protein
LYDRLAKQENITQSDEHIRQNRDNKNNLRVNVK